MNDLASQLRWFSEKKKWPKGLEGMPELLAKAADALRPAEPPPALSADEVLSDVKNFAHWHHLNEWTLKNGRKPSDSEIDFEVEAYRKIVKAVRANSAPSVAVNAVAPVDVYKAVGSFIDNDTFDKDHVSAICRAIASALSAQVQDLAERKPVDLNITKEWFEKRAALEGDHEIGAGRLKLMAGIDPSSEEGVDLHLLAYTVPEGWQLVPIEPTQEMCEAAPSLPAIDAIDDLPLKKSGWSMSAIVNRKRYLAMLAAARAKREG